MINNASNANSFEEKVSMTEQQAREELHSILNDLKAIKEQNYQNTEIALIRENISKVHLLKSYLNDYKLVDDLSSGLSHCINQIEKDNNSNNVWRNVSERSLNKICKPVKKGKEHPDGIPFEWNDNKGNSFFIKNGDWDARNSMVTDVLASIILRKASSGSIPKGFTSLFTDKDKVIGDDEGYHYKTENQMRDSNPENIQEPSFDFIFNDYHFRRLTSSHFSSNDILKFVTKTSIIEFKLNYPIRILNGESLKDSRYQMRHYSRLFTFKPQVIRQRKDGIVQLRRYYISMDTFLGKLFRHNLLMKNYDWIDSSFYKLPLNAQHFYRHFILHNDFQQIQIYCTTIKNRLNLNDNNITNQLKTIEKNIFGPLIKYGYIS